MATAAARIAAMQPLTKHLNSSNASSQRRSSPIVPGIRATARPNRIANLRASGRPREEAVPIEEQSAKQVDRRRLLVTAAAAGLVGAWWQESRASAGDEKPRRGRLEDLPELKERMELNKDTGFSFRLPRTERPLKRGTTLSRGLGEPEQKEDDDDDEEEEILVLEGVTVPTTQTTSFDVYINRPGVDPSTPLTATEYVGTFYNVAHSGPPGVANKSTNMRMGIGCKLKRLGITDLDNLVISLVPREAGPEDVPVTVGGARIEFE